MNSETKLAANRRNAQLSTGPRSDAGKAIASRNAVKHGLLSHKPLIPGESVEEFTAFTDQWLDDLKPMGARQGYLVEQIISMHWRKRRIGQIEGEIYAQDRKEAGEFDEPLASTVGRAFARDAERGNSLTKLHRHEAFLERSIQRNMKELDRLQALPAVEEPVEEKVRNEPTAQAGEDLRTSEAAEKSVLPAQNDAPGDGNPVEDSA